MKKNVIYMRQSLDKGKQPHSINTQKVTCLEYAQQNGWVIDDIYNEGNRSARKTTLQERPELQRLLQDIKLGRIGRILVFKRDRLARNVEQYLTILREIKEYKVEIHFTAENEAPLFEGVAGEFIESILAGVSHYEAENIVRRIQNSMIPLAKQGKWVAGTPPFGYIRFKPEDKSDTKNLEIDSKKQRIILLLFNDFLALSPDWILNHSPAAICNELRRDSELQDLQNVVIWKILKQPLYKGKMVQFLNGKPIEAEYDCSYLSMFEQDDIWKWNRVNEILKGIPNLPLSSQEKMDMGIEDLDDESTDVVFPLFRNKIYCGYCNSLLETKEKMYRCPQKECKNSPRMKTVHDVVFTKLLKHLYKKANEDWNKVKEQLEIKTLTPIAKHIKNVEKALIAKKEVMKEQLQLRIINKTDESRIRLSYLMGNYKTLLQTLDDMQRKYFYLQEFINELSKDEVLSFLLEGDLSIFQKENLLSLVKSVHYKKKDVQIRIYTMKEGVLNE
ncbi:recombinase family protein [Bacillus sp. 1P06AnD]|uniref:recombinase family protein n=1 Tax=Bacillus sp. 1P06AnD TaxID=3132208 RepID=UPI0039A2D271